MWNRTELYLEMKLYHNCCRNSKLTSLSGPLLRVIRSSICYWCASRSWARTSLPQSHLSRSLWGWFSVFVVFFFLIMWHVMSCLWDQHCSHFTSLLTSLPCLHCCPLLFHVLWMGFSWEILPGDVSWYGRTLPRASLFWIFATKWICLIV